jgi:hypothetical protein
MWPQIKRVGGIVLLVGLIASQSGCALVMVPGLAGIGAAGYLWGKEASREAAHDSDAAEPDAPRAAR